MVDLNLRRISRQLYRKMVTVSAPTEIVNAPTAPLWLRPAGFSLAADDVSTGTDKGNAIYSSQSSIQHARTARRSRFCIERGPHSKSAKPCHKGRLYD